MQNNVFVMVLLATGFTFFATALGSAVVFFFKKKINQKLEQAFMGFASGVMIAAAMFSLLLPAIEKAESYDLPVIIPVAAGFTIGWLFLFIMDKIVGSFEYTIAKNSRIGKRTRMLILAITLHNFPEGLAVGLAFVIAASSADASQLAAATALAIGVGVQNFPEGAAVSLPLKKEGLSSTRAFTYGALTAAVEPLAGISAVLLVSALSPLMPWLLAFAAGAMVYVVVADLIPQANEYKNKVWATSGTMLGFIVMMCLDVALG